MTLTPTKRWSIILVGSLAVNIFLIGALIAGIALRGPGGIAGMFGDPPSSPPPPRATAGFESFSMPFAMRSLGSEVRPLARETFRDHRREFIKNRKALSQGRRDAVQALGTAQFNPASLESALKELRARDLLAREVVHRSVVDFATKLTPEQRERFANAITVREAERIKRIKERRRHSRSKHGKFGGKK